MRSKVLTILLLLPFAVFGQEVAPNPDSAVAASLSTFELMPVFNPWLLSSNPAGHRFNPDIYPGRLDLNYESGTGDFKRAMNGDTLQKYSFQTERYKRIKRTFFYGNFSYDKSFERNCNYSDMNDAYRGTPYLLIDSTTRNDIIDREFFTLRGDISTPLFWKVNWGMSADMDVGLAAQNRDPRPKNKVMNLALSSGLLLDLSPVRIGVNGLFSYYNEDIEVDIIEKNVHLAFFQLHGFDSHTYHVAASFNRLYQERTYGGEGQLNAVLGPVNTLFGGKYLYINETADDGRKAGDASWSYMKNDSELEGNELRLFSATTLKTANTLQTLNASYQVRYTVGAEIIQRLEQVGEAGAVDWVDYGAEEKYTSNAYDLDLDYAWYWMRDKYRKGFEFSLGANYFGREQFYYLPDMQDRYRNRILSTALAQTVYFGRHECTFGIEWKFKKNLDSFRRFGGGDFISDDILTDDFRYFTSDYKAYTLNFSYAVALNRLFEKYFLRTSISGYNAIYYMPRDAGIKRMIFNFSTGVIF